MSNAAVADSGEPPSRRRGSSGAERKYICTEIYDEVVFISRRAADAQREKRGIADWESRLPGGGSRAVSNGARIILYLTLKPQSRRESFLDTILRIYKIMKDLDLESISQKS